LGDCWDTGHQAVQVPTFTTLDLGMTLRTFALALGPLRRRLAFVVVAWRVKEVVEKRSRTANNLFIPVEGEKVMGEAYAQRA